LADKVQDFIKANKHQDKIKVVHEHTLLGTAGTLLANLEFIGEGPVLVAHADNLTKFDYLEFMKAHNSRPLNCEITMMLFKPDNPSECGMVELRDGIVEKFYEKVPNSPGILGNAAIYIFESSVLLKMSKIDGILDISLQLIPLMLGKIYTFINKKYHRDIGTLENYQKAQIEFTDKL
jgi:mannose-1-phosphate guanylyltransferase